ncbi:MAG: hypothetical protein ABSC55_07725 [Syntrophorhabdales bacterium]
MTRIDDYRAKESICDSGEARTGSFSSPASVPPVDSWWDPIGCEKTETLKTHAGILRDLVYVLIIRRRDGPVTTKEIARRVSCTD